ncbi:MAG TPA: CoA ester lyase [Jatrophihabitans sp.]|jgi:citrate lyase subunit beta/citryl-CoA lyase
MSDLSLKPHRSVLYMPGSNERALEKAKGLPADALILDLEDAVSPDAKDDARRNVCTAVTGGAYGKKILTIRVNGLGTQWHDEDVRAAAVAKPAAIVVPKVNSAEEVRQIEAALDAAGGTDVAIWAMIETPIAVLDAYEIASSTPRLTTFIMGTNDLIKEIRGRITPDRIAVIPSLAHAIIAARAAGKLVIDGVYNDVKDELGFVAECRQGRILGFDGKTLIHPGQVEPANEVFAPSPEEIEHALAVIAAFDAAKAEGKGVATVNGKLIENLHVEEARRAIAFTEAISAAVAE